MAFAEKTKVPVDQPRNEIMRTAWQLLRVSYEIGDWGLIGGYLWHQVIMRRKPNTETDYFD